MLVLKQNRKGLFLLLLAVIVLAAEFIMPMMSAKVNAAAVVLLLAIITLVILSDINAEKYGSILIKFIPVFMIDIVDILFNYVNGAGGMGTDLFLLYKSMIWAIIAWYIIKIDDKRLAVAVLATLSIFYVITSVTTQIGSNVYPGICRALTNSGERDNEIIAFAKHYNVGGFSFVYTVVLLVPICVYLLRNKLFNRIVVIAALVPMIMMVLSAGFTTAMLFTTLSAVLFFLPKRFNKILIWMILGLVVFSLMGEVIGNGFISISNSVESRLVSDRLYDIGATLKGETIGVGDFDSRQTLWKMDIDLFFEHPFFGASRSGGHSYILDELSEHGLVGLCFLLVQFITIFKMFVKPYKKSKAYGYIFFVFFMQIGLSFLNPVMSQIVFVTIIPLTLYIFEGLRVIRD